MAIREEFGHVVIGTEVQDVEPSLLQILRPEINLATAYHPFSDRSMAYFQDLGIENNFIRAGVGHDSGYGRDVADFFYKPGKLTPAKSNVLPHTRGFEAMLEDLYERSAMMSRIVGCDRINVMIRLLGDQREHLVVHVDNTVTYRALQTIIGDGRTLALPDRYVDVNKLKCSYDERGQMCSNGYRADFNDKAHLIQINEHHMSIHKGAVFPNPLYHAAPTEIPEMGIRSGTRALATFDIAEPS